MGSGGGATAVAMLGGGALAASFTGLLAIFTAATKATPTTTRKRPIQRRLPSHGDVFGGPSTEMGAGGPDHADGFGPVTDGLVLRRGRSGGGAVTSAGPRMRSEEHTSELQSRLHLVCRLLLEK